MGFFNSSPNSCRNSCLGPKRGIPDKKKTKKNTVKFNGFINISSISDFFFILVSCIAFEFLVSGLSGVRSSLSDSDADDCY